jgi:pre-mRNA-splicing factor CWC26
VRLSGDDFGGSAQITPPAFTCNPRAIQDRCLASIMSLADYLAANYLNADARADKKSKSKKRKRKRASEGLVIADDDARGWENDGRDGEDEDGPVMGESVPVARSFVRTLTSPVNNTSAEFRKAKTSNWKTLTGAPAAVPADAASAEADAIIASAAAENQARAAADEDAPMILEEENVEVMESGAHAGLQSGADLAAQLKRQARREKARLEAEGAEAMGKGSETIYRDASGRIVNVAMKRAEARAKADAEEAKKAKEIEDAKGDVARLEKERRKEQLKDAKYMNVARYADDKELNEELKERERWDDPAAQFMKTKKTHSSQMGRPLYQGHAPPNRYGIRPGAKWDGVDRGNGFESEWFKARNRQTRLKALDYAWQTDE